jgi:SAM-dependent methyltransferase
MKETQQQTLLSLGPLGQTALSGSTTPCKICQSTARYVDATDFYKCASGHPFGWSGIEVRWYHCNHCGFLFTPFLDDWQGGDFVRFIYNDDYARVDPDYVSERPRRTAGQLARILAGHQNKRILDYGSGTGLTAKRMAEIGFAHVESYDPFSAPARPTGKFDLITCFEVIEHSPDPIGTVADILRFAADDGACIIVGETLQPDNIEHLWARWWYCAPRNGHCSTFTDDTLAILARQFGLHFHPGPHVHCLRRSDAAWCQEIARKFGEPLISETVGAPGYGSASGWHGREWDFRWTAAARVVWNVPVPRDVGMAAIVRVRIPVVMEIRPRFAAECRIEVDGVSSPIKLKGKSICAELPSTACRDTMEVALLTPELHSPAQLRGEPDRRSLGLAIRCEEKPGIMFHRHSG